MPFEGASIPAPIMAAKQGMMDAALHGVTDQARPVVQYVAGALTGKGAGLLQPVTQANQAATQSALSQVSQAGQSMTIGKGEFWGSGQATGDGRRQLGERAVASRVRPVRRRQRVQPGRRDVRRGGRPVFQRRGIASLARTAAGAATGGAGGGGAAGLASAGMSAASSLVSSSGSPATGSSGSAAGQLWGLAPGLERHGAAIHRPAANPVRSPVGRRAGQARRHGRPGGAAGHRADGRGGRRVRQRQRHAASAHGPVRRHRRGGRLPGGQLMRGRSVG